MRGARLGGPSIFGGCRAIACYRPRFDVLASIDGFLRCRNAKRSATSAIGQCVGSAVGVRNAGYRREPARGLELEAFLRLARLDRALQGVGDVGTERRLRVRAERRLDDIAVVAD